MENTGSKIQTMGKAIQGLGIIGSIIMAILSFSAADKAYGSEEEFLIGFGIGYLIVGIISSIILGIFIIGFGELVENSQTTVSYLSQIKDINNDTKKIVAEINSMQKSVVTTTNTYINNSSEATGLSTNELIAQQAKVHETNEATPKEAPAEQMWKCPKCNNFNLANTTECMNCHTKNSNATTSNTVASDAQGMWKCPKCNNFNFANSNECMNCHTKVKFK